MLEERKAADKELASLDPAILDAAIKHGVAPAMSAKMQATFWGGQVRSGHHLPDIMRALYVTLLLECI